MDVKIEITSQIHFKRTNTRLKCIFLRYKEGEFTNSTHLEESGGLMKKIMMYTIGILLSLFFFFIVPQMAHAEVQLMEGTTPEIATKNGETLQAAINQASISGTKQVMLPAGLFYINGKIILKSHIVLTGPSTSPTTTTLTMNNGPVTTDATIKSQEAITDVTLQNFTLQYNPNIPKFNYMTNPANFYKEDLLNLGQYTKAESDAGYKATTKKALKTNINITNMILNANTVGLSTVNITKAKNISIQNSQIINSGLQSGIVVTYSDNVAITNNLVKNLGRTGIVLYYGNSQVTITNNKIIDWMQRYGSYHYDAVKQSGQALDSMQDAAIDSYGPANEYVTVRNNQIYLSSSANKPNPNNAMIAKKWKLKTVPHYVRYTALRASGIQNAVYQGNIVNIDSPDTFSFFTANMRKNNIVTRPKAITVTGNQFTARNVDYPIRLFAGISNGNMTNGITIQANNFRILGQVSNYYRSLVNVREVPVTENNKTTYYPTALVTMLNNKIQSKSISTLVDGSSTSKKDVLQLLILNNNTYNGTLNQTARNYISATIKPFSYSKKRLGGTLIWNADETKSKYIKATILPSKTITIELKPPKSKMANFSIPMNIPKGASAKLQISESKTSNINASTMMYQAK
ncbi:right-handed parallel beta-helix repeat-containing protein [Listeria grandensis]|nr:right-handed parallel beta-helix repeat-containing protein [Listeria grandensis]